MAIKKQSKSVGLPVKHITSHHPAVFLTQAIIFVVIAVVVSYGVFVLISGRAPEKFVKNSQNQVQPVNEEMIKEKNVDESLFQPQPDNSIDDAKLENLFPEFKTQ